MRWWLLMLAPLLTAAIQPPPAAFAPYIRNGHFEPGDFGWLRGQFAGASPAEQAAWKPILAWRQRCRADDLAIAHAELAALGVKAGSTVDSIPYRTLLCDQVASEPENMNLKDWAAFAHDVATVKPIAKAFLAAVAIAENAAERATRRWARN